MASIKATNDRQLSTAMDGCTHVSPPFNGLGHCDSVNLHGRRKTQPPSTNTMFWYALVVLNYNLHIQKVLSKL